MTEQEWLAGADVTRMLAFLRGRAEDRSFRLFACACCRRIWRLLLDDRSRRAVEVAEEYADGLVSADERQQAWYAAFQATDLWFTWGANEIAGFAAAAAGLAVSAAGEPPPNATHAEPYLLVHLLRQGAGPLAVAEGVSACCSEAVTRETRARQRAKALDKASWWGRWWQKTKWSFLDTDFRPFVSEAQRAERQTVVELQAAVQRAQIPLLHDFFGNPFPSVTIDPAWRSWRDGCVVHIAQAIYDERRFADLAILADALEEAGCTDAAILRHCREPGEHGHGCWVVDRVLAR
jgi:hypothetical protein